jgi:hypothetical protein
MLSFPMLREIGRGCVDAMDVEGYVDALTSLVCQCLTDTPRVSVVSVLFLTVHFGHAVPPPHSPTRRPWS